MNHLSEGELLAYLDGALGPDRHSAAELHLADCPECRSGFEELRAAAAEFSGAVALLDVEAPALTVMVPQRSGRRHSSARVVAGARRALLRAAVVVFLVGGVALGALPGSPVRAWVTQNLRPSPVASAEARDEVGLGPTEEVAEPIYGVSVLPVGGEARVVISDLEGEVLIRVRLVNGVQLSVQWTGSKRDPHFRTAPGRIEVVGGTSGSLVVEAPRTARTTIEVGEEPYAVVEGGVLRPLVPTELTGEDEVVFSTPSPGD